MFPTKTVANLMLLAVANLSIPEDNALIGHHNVINIQKIVSQTLT